MPELDKVIKGLERCRYSLKSHCDGCPYVYEDLCSTNDCTADLASDAFALLKERVTATVISIHRNGFGSRVGACPNCQSVLHYEYNQSFCGKCGQAVKWYF